MTLLRAAAIAWLAMIAGCVAAANTAAEFEPVRSAVPRLPRGDAVEAVPPAQLSAAREVWQRQRHPAQSYAEVPRASELVEPVSWPSSIDTATRDRAHQLGSKLSMTGGREHITAKSDVLAMGYPALFAVLERLRELDYSHTDQAMFGFELNKMLEQLTGGLNARYAAVQIGEVLPPAKAQWNTLTVSAWAQVLARWPDPATLEQSIAERRERQNR